MRDKAMEGIQEMASYGLGTTTSGARHLLEASLLHRFYSKVDYSVAENDDADLADLDGFLRQMSEILNHAPEVLRRMVDLSSQSGQSNFLYVANDRTLLYITVFKTHTFHAEIRTYSVDGGLPAGGFVVSTGSWQIERQGHGGKVSLWKLMEVFKPMN